MRDGRISDQRPHSPRHVMAVRLRHLVMVAATAIGLVTLASCDRFPAQNAIGASLSPGGQVEAVYSACPYEQVDRVELLKVVGTLVGDANDVVLWEIERVDARAVSPKVFVVSQTPPGFRTIVALQHPPASGNLLAVEVVSSKVAGAATTFRLGELRMDRVVSQGRTLQVRSFLEMGQSRCG